MILPSHVTYRSLPIITECFVNKTRFVTLLDKFFLFLLTNSTAFALVASTNKRSNHQNQNYWVMWYIHCDFQHNIVNLIIFSGVLSQLSVLHVHHHGSLTNATKFSKPLLYKWSPQIICQVYPWSSIITRILPLSLGRPSFNTRCNTRIIKLSLFNKPRQQKNSDRELQYNFLHWQSVNEVEALAQLSPFGCIKWYLVHNLCIHTWCMLNVILRGVAER